MKKKAPEIDKEKKKRFDAAINHLISVGLIDGKAPVKSISEKLQMYSSNISSARRGDVRYLNPKFINNFCSTYNNIISANWLQDGVGEMLTGMEREDKSKLFSEDKLTSLSKEELIFIVKQLMTLHSEQTEMYQMLIRQNDQMIRLGQERFTKITDIISNSV